MHTAPDRIKVSLACPGARFIPPLASATYAPRGGQQSAVHHAPEAAAEARWPGLHGADEDTDGIQGCSFAIWSRTAWGIGSRLMQWSGRGPWR